MSTAAAKIFDHDEGLTEFELRVATALMHGRYRSAFSAIRPRETDDGGSALEIWSRGLSDRPALRLQRLGPDLVAIKPAKGVVASAKTIEGLMDEIAPELPHPLPL